VYSATAIALRPGGNSTGRPLGDAAPLAELDPLPAEAQLSPREREILGLIAAGKENGEIAPELHLSPKTVKSTITRLLRKLGLRNRTEAAVYAARSPLRTTRPFDTIVEVASVVVSTGTARTAARERRADVVFRSRRELSFE